MAPALAGVPWRRAARPGEPRDAEPEWHRRFRTAWETPSRTRSTEELGLLEAARPLIDDARRTLRECLLSDLGPDVPPGLPDLLAAAPPLGWLTMAVQPALAEELAAASARGLDGATPRDRYAAFVRGLADPVRALRIWAAYPVLARQAVEILDDWVAARLAFARELAADLPAVTAAFGGGAGLGALTGVEFGQGETHRGGRTVAIVRFERVALVHKPRSLGVDLCFDRLLGWFNDAGVPHPLRRPRLLDRGDRGWSEYIEPAPCAPADLPAFFWRMGALLALTHAVHGYDLHADNVIAAGADPVVIDLEALFHTSGTQPNARRARLGDPAAARLDASVLRTGLLPGPLVMPDVDTERPFGVDISPLGTVPDRRSLIPTPLIDDPGTDRMRVRLGYRTVPPPAGRLRLPGGGTVDPRPHRDALVAGYTAAYRRLASAGTALLAPGGPLDGCADVPVRLIQLSTFLYVRLLLESWRPAEMRDAALRERGLARLDAGWPGVPHRDALIASEKAAVWRGEVPVFEVRPGHRDVWLEDGTRLAGVLPVPPLEETAARLGALDEDDLAAQTAIIDASFAALQPGPAAARAPRPSGDLLRGALGVARWLDAAAVRSGDRIGWLGVEVVDARTRRVAPAGLDLYGGLPGIGLFLTYLSAVTGEPWVESLAECVADEVAARVAAASAVRGTVPPLGPVYHLAHAAAVHGRRDLAEAARGALLPPASGLTSGDVLEGEAGAVLSALALHAVLPGEQVAGVARAAGERLLARDLTDPGFGYGASGAAVALARLDELCPDPRFASRARSLAAGEQDPGRDPGWCQGAAGVALARLELAARYRSDAALLERSLATAAAVLRDAAPQDDSLCHGTAAVYEALSALDGTAPVPRRDAWRTALPEPAPGLLAGLSGIGYALLRRARPAEVPPVLALAPPAPSASLLFPPEETP
ncbi:type 2 lanthipeptide synthetase LanM family protein [Actinomadura montaniterrae]|uniref:Type 2 lantipeptide synthetase LanM n=1 Tax=Actinomadura montaniterrae TaxID=1803903 RepID=A0A6L3VQ84_9ACTN|nr:type 2 lanthipeptide synthetase LanM family protein [Actinomadura montaniterrae]KAB2368830.1 type 2 lantipeptide synthetase LanM [Actinomadura montaniterrae]